MARITVDELHQKIEAGKNPVTLDSRPHTELEQDGLLVRGALHMTLDELQVRHAEIPRDRDVIFYCSCANEESSARAGCCFAETVSRASIRCSAAFGAWREQIGRASCRERV